MKTEKLWITQTINNDDIDKLSTAANIPSLIAKVFLTRGIADATYIKDFLNPDINTLIHPFLLQDLEKAACRICSAIKTREKIIIYGDYDVDGITSTSILYLFLTSQGANVFYYIPDRIEDGYGLSIQAIDKVLEHEPSLIITVDCGIVSFDEVEYINQKNIEIIVTDHHSCREKLPRAYAVVNPHRDDDTYPFKDLAGVGVTFKLIHGICINLNLGVEYLKYLDLVALGTVADVVPLKGENRVIVYEGLKTMAKTENLGLKALIDVARVGDKDITSYTLGFALGPRINAAGRLGDPERAVQLFTTDSVHAAQDISLTLNDENKLRQDTESEILELALLQIESDPQYRDEPVLVVYGKKWHHGVIGIVSSRITDRYYKPSIVISVEKGEAKGSCRSIAEFSIIDALTTVADILPKYGGHRAAAGLSLKESDIPQLRSRINEYAKKHLTDYDLIPKMFIDTSVSPEEITMEAVKTIDMLAPFGQENPKPMFLVKDFMITDIRTLSENRHLKLQVSKSGLVFDSIGFSMGSYAENLDKEGKFDIAFYPEINTWNNVDKIQFMLKDIKTVNFINMEKDYYKSLENCFNLNNGSSTDNLQLAGNEENKFSTYFNSLEKLDISTTFIDKVKQDKNLIIINSLPFAELIIETFQIHNLFPQKDFLIAYGNLPNADQTEPLLQNILLINPELKSYDLSGFSNIIFAGAMVSTLGLNDFINYPNKIQAYSLPHVQGGETLNEIIISRQEVTHVYKYFTLPGHKKINIGDINLCVKEINNKFKISMNSYKLIKILEILDELGIFKFKYSEKYNIIVDIKQNSQKNDLTNSRIFSVYSNLKVFNV